MKRLIITMLTLALITGMYAGNASAGNSGVTEELYTAFNFITGRCDLETWQGGQYDPGDAETGNLNSMNYTGNVRLVDPADCPNIMDPNDCPDIMDLWIELVDAGFTEDEAFDLIEMVLDNGYPTSQWHSQVTESHHANIDNVWRE